MKNVLRNGFAFALVPLVASFAGGVMNGCGYYLTFVFAAAWIIYSRRFLFGAIIGSCSGLGLGLGLMVHIVGTVAPYQGEGVIYWLVTQVLMLLGVVLGALFGGMAELAKKIFGKESSSSDAGQQSGSVD